MKMTPMVKIALVVLRVYLLVLLTLILISFVRMLRTGGTSPTANAPAAVKPQPSTRLHAGSSVSDP
jgi:hypothetical protein